MREAAVKGGEGSVTECALESRNSPSRRELKYGERETRTARWAAKGSELLSSSAIEMSEYSLLRQQYSRS